MRRAAGWRTSGRDGEQGGFPWRDECRTACKHGRARTCKSVGERRDIAAMAHGCVQGKAIQHLDERG